MLLLIGFSTMLYLGAALAALALWLRSMQRRQTRAAGTTTDGKGDVAAYTV